MNEVDYSILDRPYRLNVSPGDEQHLSDAVDLVNKRAEALRQTDRSLTRERLAILVALQIAYDSLGGTLVAPPEDTEAVQRVSSMTKQCEAALNPNKTA